MRGDRAGDCPDQGRSGEDGLRDALQALAAPGDVALALVPDGTASRYTFSAPEAFAFALKQAGRATVVGETTGGGGHSGTFTTLPHGFGMLVATTRSVDTRTGRGWQTEGVHPNREDSPERALETALELARKR